MIVELYSHYRDEQDICYLKSDLSEAEANIRCAYIQILLCELPCGDENPFSANEMKELLLELYPAEFMESQNQGGADYSINLYENWEYWCAGHGTFADSTAYLEVLNRIEAAVYARPAVLSMFIRQIESSWRDDIANKDILLSELKNKLLEVPSSDGHA